MPSVTGATRKEEKMICCFLCGVGGYQKGSEEFESHLMHQHGVVFDDGLDFINKLSEFKTVHLRVPDLNKKKDKPKPRKPALCQKCRGPPKPAEVDRGNGGGGGDGLLLGEDGLPSLYGWVCRCALCNYTSGDDTTFWSHITKSHGVDWYEYKKKHGASASPVEGRDGTFTCIYCQEKVKHWPGNVKKHMLRKHQLFWEDFVEKWKRENPKQARKEKAKETSSQGGATLEETSEGQNVTGSVTESLNKSKKVKPLNIKDKTNTYCNECNVTFATRIQFLGHCSDVHDVKFKGRAGQPLVIPSVEDQDRSVTSPPRKKAKVNVSNPSPDSKKDRDPVPCQYCGKEFSNYFNMERHIRQSCKASENKYELEEKDFKCNLCPRQFSKQGNLKNHMMGEHNVMGEDDEESEEI